MSRAHGRHTLRTDAIPIHALRPPLALSAIQSASDLNLLCRRASGDSGTEEEEGPRTPPWKTPTTGDENGGARGGAGGVKYLGPMRKVDKDDSTEEDSWDEDVKTKTDFGVPE